MPDGTRAHRRVLQTLCPNPNNRMPMWSRNPDPPTHHTGMQEPQPPQTHTRIWETRPMGETDRNLQRDNQTDHIYKTLERVRQTGKCTRPRHESKEEMKRDTTGEHPNRRREEKHTSRPNADTKPDKTNPTTPPAHQRTRRYPPY